MQLNPIKQICPHNNIVNSLSAMDGRDRPLKN